MIIICKSYAFVFVVARFAVTCEIHSMWSNIFHKNGVLESKKRSIKAVLVAYGGTTPY